MKQTVIALALLMVLIQPVEAKDRFHKVCRVLGTPIWAVGWTAALVTDAISTPIRKGWRYYTHRAFVRW